MRKLVAILLLCCLLVVTSGYHIFYHYHLAEAKREMRQQLLQLPGANVTQLLFSGGEMVTLGWEGNNEFRYHGEMYDVISIEKKGGHFLVRCVADGKETALLAQYAKAQQQSGTNASTKSILKLLNVHFLPSSVAFLQTPDVKNSKPESCFHSWLPHPTQPIVTPPPQHC